MKRLLVVLTILAVTIPAFGQRQFQTLKYGIYNPVGVYMAADSSKIILPDVTIAAASVSKIEAYSLLKPKFMRDLGAFRMKEIAGSLRDSLKVAWPNNFTVHITTAQDCVAVVDREQGTTHLVITFGSDNATGVHFLDGILRISTSVGVYEMDIPNDKLWLYDTGGKKATGADLASDLALGTDQVTFSVVVANQAILNNATNSVSAIRNPFQPDGLPWWIAPATTASGSVFQPYDRQVYDTSQAHSTYANYLSSKGTYYHIRDSGAGVSLSAGRSILTASADSWQAADFNYHTAGTGGTDLAWAPTTTASLAVIEGGSAAGKKNDMVLMGDPTSGIYMIHADLVDPTNGGKVLINDDAFGPYEKGVSLGAWPLHSTADFSEGAHTLTNNNTVTFATGGPTGNYADFVAASSMSMSVADHADFALMTELSVFAWIYRDIDSGAIEAIVTKWESTGSQYSYDMHINANDGLTTNIYADANDGVVSANSIITLGKWHLVGFTYDGVTVRQYVNSELTGTAAETGAIDESTAVNYIGARSAGGATSFFDGRIAGVVITDATWTPEEVKGVYNLGQAFLQAGSALTGAGLDAASVVSVKCIDEGWCVSASVDTATVYKYVAPGLVPWKRYLGPGAGALADVAIWWDAGADSVALAMGSATDLQFVQPDPNIYAAATYRDPWVQPEATQAGWSIVDSTGQQGVFWNGDDAVDASANAGIGGIQFLAGTYPSFDADQTGQVIQGTGGSFQPAYLGAGIALIDGGIVDDAVDLNARGVTLQDITLKTTSGGGTVFECLESTGNALGALVKRVHCIESDADGFEIGGSKTTLVDVWISGAGVDGHGINITNNQLTIRGGIVDAAAGGQDILCQSSGDNFQIIGFRSAGNAITINAGCDNGIIDGTINDNAISNSGTSNTIGDQETY